MYELPMMDVVIVFGEMHKQIQIQIDVYNYSNSIISMLIMIMIKSKKASTRTSPLRAMKKLTELHVATKPSGSSISDSSTPTMLACAPTPTRPSLKQSLQEVNQSINLSINQRGQSINQLIHQSKSSINQSTYPSIKEFNQSIKISIKECNQSIKQSINEEGGSSCLDACRNAVELAVAVPTRVLHIRRPAPEFTSHRLNAHTTA
jgi:hypothetical protein